MTQWFQTLNTLEQFGIVSGFLIPGVLWLGRRVHNRARAKVAEVLATAVSHHVTQALAPVLLKLDSVVEQLTLNGGAKNTLKDQVCLLMNRQLANMEASNQPRFECNGDGACMWANEALCNLFGLSVNTMIDMQGSGWLRVVEDAATVASRWRACVKAQIPYSDTYEITNTARKTRYRVEARARPLYGVKRDVVAIWSGDVTVLEELPYTS